MLANPNIHPMEELKRNLRQILDVIPPQSEIFYIDYPVYNNGGDLLIMKGTEAFFKDNDIRVLQRYSVWDIPFPLNIPKDAIIVMQGGGNFGDLYPVHQKMREKIIAGHPKNRIVILPQTIFFKSDIELKKTAKVLNFHKDLHFYVRDQTTYELALKEFNQTSVYLCPDMAHQLWPIQPKGKAVLDRLFFFREDIEKNKEQLKYESAAKGDGAFLDWNTLYNRVDRKIIRMVTSSLKARNTFLPVQWFWSKYSDYMVHKAIKNFSKYKNVTTSRLHGHILACLLDQPNVLLDNSYGKNSNYYWAWTRNNPKGILESGQTDTYSKSVDKTKANGSVALSDGTAL
ncbi:pyruvyl transferase EpsO [Paenibacillus amylolyticus]|uniref:Pyruvyl transferase EpsO n=1 Tax=Paenibacillus amylolyticus TaxID=1451 RepID=A0AAP5LR21_PAEAM|nr:polysaccharide pyruvyl transferase family protein [Paenibacillus amylolyticus]MDR6724024.1 pyruvyl transferase EpsO [Paenibacillus amylolyticus]